MDKLICDVANGNRNTSCSSQTPLFETVVGVTMLLLAIICVVSNTVVLVFNALNQKRRFTAHCMIISLALADLLVGMFTMPYYAIELVMGQWDDLNELCPYVIFVDYVPVLGSLLSTVAIAHNRYSSIAPSTEKSFFTNGQKNLIRLIIVWTLAVGVWLASRFERKSIQIHGYNECMAVPSADKNFALFTSVVMHHIPTVALIYMNSVVLVHIRVLIVRRMAMLQEEDTSQTVEPNTSITPSERRSSGSSVTKRLSTAVRRSLGLDSTEIPEALWLAPITVMFMSTPVEADDTSIREMKVIDVLCSTILVHIMLWIPASVIFDLSITFNLLPEINSFRLLAYLNSAFNPFIYAFSSEDFHRVFRENIGSKSMEHRISHPYLIKRNNPKMGKIPEAPAKRTPQTSADPIEALYRSPGAPCPSLVTSKMESKNYHSPFRNLAKFLGIGSHDQSDPEGESYQNRLTSKLMQITEL